MAEVSIPQPERARKIQQVVLQRVNEAESQAAIAAAISRSEATVNRLLNDHLENFAALLSQIGLKVVPAEFKCVEPEAYAFLTKTHERFMRKAPQLIWEQDET